MDWLIPPTAEANAADIFCFTFKANDRDDANCFADESSCKTVQGMAGRNGGTNVSSCGKIQ